KLRQEDQDSDAILYYNKFKANLGYTVRGTKQILTFNLIISWHLFLLGDFASSCSRTFSFIWRSVHWLESSF
ncbi:hypothetical protein STEG23_016210, partial [Scotinomys teguina]